MLDEFIQYLNGQIQEPYLWGGQHTKLTPDNYKEVIAKRESLPENRARVESYCEKMFAKGYDVLYGYDCSGLGMYWLQNVKGIYSKDMTADSMMHQCVDLDTPEPPEKGWWVFRLNEDKTKAVHIGYMVDDEYLVEAKGRDYGVSKTKWREGAWACWGIPKCFEDEIRRHGPEPEPPEPTRKVKVIGGSVRVRAGDNVLTKKLFTAHRGDTFPLIDIAPSGWYQIEIDDGWGYITNKPRYTKLVIE